MRIRKRKVPLPLSLLSPVPLTDPHLFSRSPVQPHDFFTPPTSSSDHFPTSDTDPRHPIAATPTTTTTTTSSTKANVSLAITGVDEGVQMSNNDDASNATITTRCAPAYHNNNATTTNNSNDGPLPLPLPLSNNAGSWCDGDRAIPLKKRRTMIMKCDLQSNNGRVVEKKEDEQEDKGSKSTVIGDDDDNDNGNTKKKENDNSNSNTDQVVGAKKSNSKRGNTIMEGSRCSRVNGRGWRCCQPTLVGYSLCEHHLGKGRLRSMTSAVKGRSSSSTKKNTNNNTSNSVRTSKFAIGGHEDRETVESSGNEKKMERMSSFGSGNSSKRVKLGVVKARSLSSLLGQTNTMNNNVVGDHENAHQQERINN